MNAVAQYFRDLTERFGAAWNRFWFAPGDPLTSSVLRIVVGVIACLWLVSFSFDLQTLLGPQGWLSVQGLRDWRAGRGFSLLDYVSSEQLLWTVHVASLAVLVLFTIGLFTRVTAVLTVVVLVSYLWRAPMLNGPMEELLAMLLVYLCIGPCGRDLSVDAWRKRRGHRESVFVSQPSSLTTISMRLIQVHLTAIYGMMVLAKCRGAVWWTGEAVYWMAAGSRTGWVDLGWLSGHPNVVSAWTHAIVVFEFAFAVLVWNRTARPLMLALAVPVWVGTLVLTGSVGFCLLMLAAHLAFIPGEFLRRCWYKQNAVGEPHSVVGATVPPRATAATR